MSRPATKPSARPARAKPVCDARLPALLADLAARDERLEPHQGGFRTIRHRGQVEAILVYQALTLGLLWQSLGGIALTHKGRAVAQLAARRLGPAQGELQ